MSAGPGPSSAVRSAPQAGPAPPSRAQRYRLTRGDGIPGRHLQVTRDEGCPIVEASGMAGDQHDEGGTPASAERARRTDRSRGTSTSQQLGLSPQASGIRTPTDWRRRASRKRIRTQGKICFAQGQPLGEPDPVDGGRDVPSRTQDRAFGSRSRTSWARVLRARPRISPSGALASCAKEDEAGVLRPTSSGSARSLFSVSSEKSAELSSVQ